MKSQVRVVGIDDSPFAFKSGKVLIVGVVMRLPSYVEGVMRTECTIDGTDANDALEKMIAGSRFFEQLKLIMIDGVALGGFNVVDISRLYDKTGIPSATVTRDPPDMVKISDALKAHFPDWENRLEVIVRQELTAIPTAHKPIYVSTAGIAVDEASKLMCECTVCGNIPEPIRIAHLISSAMVKGESRGRV